MSGDRGRWKGSERRFYYSQLELFFTIKKCPKQPALECPIDAFGASARPMVVFSGFYESH
jgi:hypothetical protein